MSRILLLTLFLLLASFVPAATTDSPSRAAIDVADIRLLPIQYIGERVRIQGVLSNVHPDDLDHIWNWFELLTDKGPIPVAVNPEHYSFGELNSLIDAEVCVCGDVSGVNSWKRSLNAYILIREKDGLTLLAPPPKSPFEPTIRHDVRFPHRRLSKGTVIAASDRRFFIGQPHKSPLQVSLHNGTLPPPIGSTVSVAGFKAGGQHASDITDALVKIESLQSQLPLQQPISVDEKRLFAHLDAHGQIDEYLFKSLIIVRGLLASDPSVPVDSDRLLLQCGRHIVPIDISGISPNSYSDIRRGSVLEVTGLCMTEFDENPPPIGFPRFRGFTIIPRTASDIRVIASPPWWTPFRLLVLILALLAVIAVTLAWNFMLKRKSEKRGKELYDERIGHALAEQKVEERTRLAVELHDSVSQTLTGIALQLDGGEVETAKTMLASCRGELRRCLWDLRSRTFEEKDMTEAVTRTITPHLNGVDATVRFNVPRERLSESLTHAILRIIRELVVNAIRHGQAKHIRIAGEMHADTVSFSVTDNGCGFDPETAPGPERGHFGLLGIRERIEDFNGDLQIASAPGKGAKFTVTLLAADGTNEQ